MHITELRSDVTPETVSGEQYYVTIAGTEGRIKLRTAGEALELVRTLTDNGFVARLDVTA